MANSSYERNGAGKAGLARKQRGGRAQAETGIVCACPLVKYNGYCNKPTKDVLKNTLRCSQLCMNYIELLVMLCGCRTMWEEWITHKHPPGSCSELIKYEIWLSVAQQILISFLVPKGVKSHYALTRVLAWFRSTTKKNSKCLIRPWS